MTEQEGIPTPEDTEHFDAKFWAAFTEAARTWTLNVSKFLIAGGLATLTVDGANTVIKAWSEGDLPRTIGSAALTGVSLFMAVKAANSIKL